VRELQIRQNLLWQVLELQNHLEQVQVHQRDRVLVPEYFQRDHLSLVPGQLQTFRELGPVPRMQASEQMHQIRQSHLVLVRVLRMHLVQVRVHQRDPVLVLAYFQRDHLSLVLELQRDC